MAKGIEMNINGLGKFYFHKKVFNAFHKKRLGTDKNHKEIMKKYNTKLK